MKLILVAITKISIRAKRLRGLKAEATKDKSAIFGMIQRGGNVIAKQVDDVSTDTLQNLIYDNVKTNSTISTDEWKSYIGLNLNYKHLTVNHGAKEYVNMMAHTNNIECFWSHLKRGVKWHLSLGK